MAHALNTFYCRGALGSVVNQISSDACAPAEKSASRNTVNLAGGRKNPAKYEKANNEKRQSDKQNQEQQIKGRKKYPVTRFLVTPLSVLLTTANVQFIYTIAALKARKNHISNESLSETTHNLARSFENYFFGTFGDSGAW